MVHGGMTLIKYLLFLFNFIFWLSGIGIIVAGAVIQIRYSNYINILGSSFLSAPIILIVVGCIIAIIGFFGCCGSIRENYCMTMTFAVLLGIIFILELGAGVASYVMRDDVRSLLHQHAQDGMHLYNATGALGVTAAWDKIQIDFKCCGLESFRDWNETKAFAENFDVPDSCCKASKMEIAKCGSNIRNMPEPQASFRINEGGCINKLRDFVVDNIALLGGVACGVALIQILGIAFSCCLSRSILKEYDDYYY